MRVIIPDQFNENVDAAAMLQAFYSRSHTSILDRLEGDMNKVRESLKKFYINYNHDSIGDCGNLLVFVEGCSMLTAKAIQDNPLYNGQESSSRYIDFSVHRDALTAENQRYLLDLYEEATEQLMTAFLEEGMPEAAAKVRTFDIARGLLPAGIPTQLSGYMSIRQWRYQLAAMQKHPIALVQQEAALIHQELMKYLPDMFNNLPTVDHAWTVTRSYTRVPTEWKGVSEQATGCLQELRTLGTATFSEFIDYGSYRDIQRHRAAFIKPIQVYTVADKWYLDHLPQTVAIKLEQYLRDYSNQFGLCIGYIEPDMPLATMVKVSITLDIPQLVYMLDLRTKPHVHETARRFMKAIATKVKAVTGLSVFDKFIHYDEVDHARRAKQTIVSK